MSASSILRKQYGPLLGTGRTNKFQPNIPLCEIDELAQMLDRYEVNLPSWVWNDLSIVQKLDIIATGYIAQSEVGSFRHYKPVMSRSAAFMRSRREISTDPIALSHINVWQHTDLCKYISLQHNSCVIDRNEHKLVSDLTVSTLRELFRHLQAWESFYESTGQDTLVDEGIEYCLWDIKALYEFSQHNLPKRQKQAINLCLYRNILEKDAAIMMGVAPTNPVAMYSTRGISSILEKMRAGKIPGVRADIDEAING